jgi:hypothetical protein
MISHDRGKLSYIKLIVGVVPPVCPCLWLDAHCFGAEMTPSRGKREEIPLENPPMDRIYPRWGSSYSRFYPVPLGDRLSYSRNSPVPLGWCSSYSRFYPVPLAGASKTAKFPLELAACITPRTDCQETDG